MYRFNLLALFVTVLFLAFQSQAQTEESVSSEKPLGRTSVGSVNLTYVSWLELVDLDNGFIADNTKHADFYGLAIGYEKEVINKNLGSAFDGSLIFGQANIGESAGAIPYQKNYVKWTGLSTSYRLAYRMSAPLTVSIGPMILGRQITWPDQPANTEIKSGSEINFGAIADIRFRLSNHWDFKQTFGTLAFKAATYWSLGLGYRF